MNFDLPNEVKVLVYLVAGTVAIAVALGWLLRRF
jgi:hypothetical protein